MTQRFYITTAIDYPNSVPHMGHAYEKVVADFYARAARLRGIETHFLIGLDEHGQKIQEAADKAGMAPQEFVDDKATVFRALYQRLEISNDDFIRTSEQRHRDFARDLFQRVRGKGDIYKDFYEGDYCISCERFLTASELVDGKCPIHERPTTIVKEESYFFRLGKYRDQVRAHIESHPEFIFPDERRREILSRLQEEVRDLSISRSTFDWGIPLPDDPAHVLYVWFDALSNYYSALLRPRDIADRFWPADCHVIGKDILWFHTMIWPAMLLSAGYDLPRQVFVHGFILDKDGRKMAKHVGNVVDPMEVVDEYSVDVLRYYFLRSFSSGKDGKFSLADLEERYNSELGNDLGNLVLRVAKLVQTRLGGRVRLGDSAELGERLAPQPVIDRYFACVDAREHNRALEELWEYVRAANTYMNDRAPWRLRDEAELAAVLGAGVEALRVIAHLVSPAMPDVARQMALALGFELGPIDSLTSGGDCEVRPSQPLFPRREKSAVGGAATREEGESPQGGDDPFAKLEIRVGRIEEAREHPDADQLFVLTVDLGEDEKRSICAGLRAHLTAADLNGRKVVVLANLKPAVLRGVPSAGMVLASDRKDGAVVPVDPGEAPVGDLVTVEGIETAPKKKLSKSHFEKVPLTVANRQVVYRGVPLRSSTGPIACDADDGAPVR
jgi:methionyl-tRNA synthetase